VSSRGRYFASLGAAEGSDFTSGPSYDEQTSDVFVPGTGAQGAGWGLVVTREGDNPLASIFGGTLFGIPRWLVYLVGVGVAYKLYKRYS
jgi:hypothetical protein